MAREKREQIIMLKLTRAEKRSIREAADIEGLPMSSWLRLHCVTLARNALRRERRWQKREGGTP